MRPFGVAGRRRIVRATSRRPPATAPGAGSRRRRPSRDVGDREHRARRVEIVHRHREAALDLVAAPRRGDRVELRRAARRRRRRRRRRGTCSPPSSGARPTAAPCGSRGPRARTSSGRSTASSPDRDRAHAEPLVARRGSRATRRGSRAASRARARRAGTRRAARRTPRRRRPGRR